MSNPNEISANAAHQQLFASVVLAAIDDAIADERKRGNGVDSIGHWAQSRDGQTVLRCAGIEPSQRCVEGLKGFVRRGVKTSAALTREQGKRSKETLFVSLG
ncbi:DUF6280 family protein [Sulfitobacter sp.]|uniref:DUF6280 family protein n=1 Tax=Sulfitobacter sp. TaxID=1903071 RepID=UPI003EF96735